MLPSADTLRGEDGTVTCVLIPNVPLGQKGSVLSVQPRMRILRHFARSGHQLGPCQGDSDHPRLQGLTRDDILSAGMSASQTKQQEEAAQFNLPFAQQFCTWGP